MLIPHLSWIRLDWISPQGLCHFENQMQTISRHSVPSAGQMPGPEWTLNNS